MKTLRLVPDQIPAVWEHIKLAVAKVEGITENIYEVYFNELFYKLLNGNCQCFIELDEDRSVRKVYVTRVETDQLRDIKVLHVLIVYSFIHSDEQAWTESYEFIRECAKSFGCKQMMTTSAVPRVWEVCKMLGLKEKYRTFTIDV